MTAPCTAPAQGKHTIELDIPEGSYLIFNRKCYIRRVGQQYMVRVGGGWQELRNYILELSQHHNISDAMSLDDLLLPENSIEAKKIARTQVLVKDIVAVDAVIAGSNHGKTYVRVAQP